MRRSSWAPWWQRSRASESWWSVRRPRGADSSLLHDGEKLFITTLHDEREVATWGLTTTMHRQETHRSLTQMRRLLLTKTTRSFGQLVKCSCRSPVKWLKYIKENISDVFWMFNKTISYISSLLSFLLTLICAVVGCIHAKHKLETCIQLIFTQ